MKHILKVAIVLIAFTAFAQKPTRLSWQEFAKDPKRVQSFRNAVATMKSRSTADRFSATYRTSWEYWANMHGYFGIQSPRGTLAKWREDNQLTNPKYDPYFVGVHDQNPPDDIAKAVWGQCQHGTDFFFPWHRLYLHYFELVLQDAANDPSLRLPYWDYTDPANLGMPAEFTTPTYTNAAGQTVDNPLFEPRRAPGWAAPGTNKLVDADMNIDLTLDYPVFLNRPNSLGKMIPGYQRRIEVKPHGDVHCSVIGCRATVMGAVPYSANDPIFYVHHANIDRMWDCWTSISGHKNPDTNAWLGKRFSFVDAKGKKVTHTVRTLFNGTFIDYVYERASKCARTQTPPPMAAAVSPAAVRSARAALAQPVMIGEMQDDVMVDAMVKKIRVTLPATASLSHPRQFAMRDQDQLPVATELILRGVRFASHPNARFLIYLERVDDPTRRAFVGTMSFFSEEASGEGHHEAMDDHRVFDATAALRALALEGTGTHNVNVVLEAVDEEVGDFEPLEDRLMIDAIELQVKRDL